MNIMGPGIAQLYLEHVYRWFGLPKKMISDRDPRFTSHFGKALLSKLGIAQNLSTTFHPQTDNLSEQKNQWIEQYLQLVMSSSPEHWTQWLDIASAVHNNQRNTTTGLSPNQILIRYEITLAPPNMPLSNNKTVENWIRNMMEHQAQAINTINKATKGNRSIPEQYSIGDQVWLEGKHLRFPHQKTKLNPKRYGPFKIIKAISSVVYQLQLPPSWKIHLFHASLLSPYGETPSHGPNFSRPPPDLIDGEAEYEVELIKSHRRHGRSRKLQYLIKWKGYPESNNTWKDTDKIHAPDLIKLYHKGNPLQRIKGRRLSLQNPHLPTWQSSRSPSLHSPQILSFLQTTRIPSNTLNPSFAHLHTRPTSSTSSTLVGSETTPPGHTPLNTPTFAKKRTAATTLRLAWSHPLLYPIHPVRRRPTTRTSPHKYVLTPCSNHQSSIYGAYIDHNDLAHIPDRPQCRQPGLSICQTFRPPNLRRPFQSLARRLRSHRQCRLGQPRQSSPPTTTSTPLSFAPSRTDSSPLSPAGKPMPRCSTTASLSGSRDSKTVSWSTKRPSNEPQRVISSTTGVYPTSASHAAPGFPARLSGSNSTTMARCRASQTPTAQNQTLTLPTCTPNPTINTLKRAMRGLGSPYRPGSSFSWWAPRMTLHYSITPSSTTMIGGSPPRSTATANSTASSPTSASSSSRCRSISTRSPKPALLARVASCLRMRQNKSTNSKTSHTKPRPRAARGSVRLTDVVVRSSGGVMLPALRSPARSDLPRLM